MARRKVKIVEDASTTENIERAKKNPSSNESIQSRQRKRKATVIEESNILNQEEIPTQKKRSARVSARKVAEIKDPLSDQDEENIADSGFKKRPATRKKASPKKPKIDTVAETQPKMKKAKVVLERLKASDVDSESNSLESEMLFKVDCIPTAKTELLIPKTENGVEGSSSESEWEEVAENDEPNLDDYKPNIPQEGVEITIDCPDLKIHKRKKKQFDWRDWVRLHINKQRKESQLNVHKTHLLCLLAHGFYVNNIINSPILRGIALSIIPSDILAKTSGKKIDKLDVSGIGNIVEWFRSAFSFESSKDAFLDFSNSMVYYFENRNALNASEYNLMFLVLARTLGLKTRFCISLYALTHKAQNLIKKTKTVKSKKAELSGDTKVETTIVAGPSNAEAPKEIDVKKEPKKEKASKKNPKNGTSAAAKREKKSRPRRSTEKSYKISSDESDNDNKDDDYAESEDNDFKEQKSVRKSLKTPKQRANRKVLSSDSAPSSPEVSPFKSNKIICWAEVFCKPTKQWVSIDCVSNLIDKPYDIEKLVPQPVTYIVAYDNESFVKDVTRRYCSDYMTSTIKLRADSDWWEETLMFFSSNSKLDKDEEKHLETLLVNKPLPTTVAGFKNHPLYALERHLLKFEAIYPPDAAPVGYFRKEPVYARECVCQLHSRETWLKEARVVRVGEEAYKIVKARPKWDRVTGTVKTDIPLDIFGFWQTEPYKPPVAVDGKVPRNEYGNVELFKPCMLPIGTVHLQLPGLNRIAKKLGIDCSAAVVGFDGHKGSVHAVFDGFIVCKEYKDTLEAAWEEEQVNAQKREEEKREKRIYGNWKKLIKGLLIRERIKLKYDVK